MTTSTGSNQLGLLSKNSSLHTLPTTIQDRKQLEGQGRSVGMGTITVPAIHCDELATTILAVKECSNNKSVRLSHVLTKACFRYN